MRRVFILAALTFAASCGGEVMSPTGSTPVPALPSGAYLLTVGIGGGGGQFSACVGSPGLQDPGALSTNVELQHSGNTVSIRADDSTATFRMDLRMSSSTLFGTASGQFLIAGRAVAVSGQGGSPADAAGSANSSGAAGNLTGNVSVSGSITIGGTGNGVDVPGLACNSGTWSLTPR